MILQLAHHPLELPIHSVSSGHRTVLRRIPPQSLSAYAISTEYQWIVVVTCGRKIVVIKE